MSKYAWRSALVMLSGIMHARSNRRGPAQRSSTSTKRTLDQEDCPVCLECFDSKDASGNQRTKVYPFACTGSVGHAICALCNAHLRVRQQYRCPLCRAPPTDDVAENSACIRFVMNTDGSVSVERVGSRAIADSDEGIRRRLPSRRPQRPQRPQRLHDVPFMTHRGIVLVAEPGVNREVVIAAVSRVPTNALAISIRPSSSSPTQHTLSLINALIDLPSTSPRQYQRLSRSLSDAPATG